MLRLYCLLYTRATLYARLLCEPTLTSRIAEYRLKTINLRYYHIMVKLVSAVILPWHDLFLKYLISRIIVFDIKTMYSTYNYHNAWIDSIIKFNNLTYSCPTSFGKKYDHVSLYVNKWTFI